MKRIKIITITLFGLVFFSCSNEESPKIEDNFLYKEVPIEPVNANYAV
ncbi:MAG: hypothetical protein GZ087_15890, partial [Flavobacterium sp.]|nr:hypothetical protein [Flavobacterium sp.]